MPAVPLSDMLIRRVGGKGMKIHFLGGQRHVEGCTFVATIY